MENNNHPHPLHDYFEFINKECLFYIITLDQEGHINIKLENMTSQDYVSDVANKIVLRLSKSKQTQSYFLDCFQYYDNKTHWKGFRMTSCSCYEVHPVDMEWFNAVFYFNKKEEQLTIHHINPNMFLLLQDFFSGFM